MGVAIGTYIHFDYNNYLRYGIDLSRSKKKLNTQGEEMSFSIFNEQRKDVINLLHQKYNTMRLQVDLIEKELNYFFAANKGEIQDEKYVQLIKNSVAERLGKTIDGMELDNNLSLTKPAKKYTTFDSVFMDSSAAEKALQTARKNPYSKDKSASHYFKTVQQRIQALSQVSLDNADTEFYQKVSQLCKDFRAIADELKATNSNKITSNILQKTGTETFFTDLDLIIGSLYDRFAHGTYFEVLVAAVASAAEARIKNESIDMVKDLQTSINKSWVANETGRTVFVKPNSRFIDMQEVVNGTSYNIVDESGNAITVTATQNKVDANLELQGIEVPASIKNYRLNTRGDVHFLTGSSIIALLQEYPTFINHYLNVVSKRFPYQSDYPSGRLVNTAQETARLMILAKALMGGTMKQNPQSGIIQITPAAYVLIINDNSKGRVKVYDLGQLLTIIEQKMKWLRIAGFDNVPIVSNYYGDVPSTAGAKQRISQIIKQLHAMQFSVSVSKDAFK